MKALLLAAGRGTRISRYLSGNPKCTVDVGGLKLIQYTVDMLKRKGVSEIGIVLGYRGEVIRNVLQTQNVKFYFNPFYDVTNSIASAWFAKDFLQDNDDMIVMNADVYMEEKLMDQILQCTKSPVMFADGTRREEADYKFFYEDGKLIKFGKELSGKEITGEYVGIGKFDKNFLPVFLRRMEQMIQSQNHSVWWENIIYDMVGEIPIYVEEVNGSFWAEVDFIEDYERILSHRGYHASFAINVDRVGENV